jgi:hypothetical protein
VNIILTEVPADETIGDVFHYQNNIVKIKCTFVTLRDLYLKQIAQEKATPQYSQAGTSIQLDASNALSLKLGALNAMNTGDKSITIERYVINP